MVCLQESELTGGQVLGGDYVRVKAKLLVVGVFVASVPLMSDSFYSQVGVIDFIHQVEDSKGGEGN